jgi:hypothetical protein
MRTRILFGSMAACAAAIGVGQFAAQAVPGTGGSAFTANAGPDVIVGSIPDYTKYGSNVVDGRTIMAYSFGTTSCNLGTQQLDWYGGTNRHPVIPQNAYRLENGRIEQIGMSWMKHGFCALQQQLCATCTSAGSGCPSQLGVGCSDPYTSSLNGSQGDLGPRYEVNPSTGAFPATGSTTWPAIPAGQTTIGRRLQIDGADLDRSVHVSATFFAECQYVHPQDALNGNGNNNASYRQFLVSVTTTSGSYNFALTGSTIQQKPAIYAWKDAYPSVTILPLDAPDGRYHVGFDATQRPDGSWHYEYAIHNLNSDAAGASLEIPLPAGAVASNVTFKGVRYHSGEPFDMAPWSITTTGGAIRWTCPQTYAQNANASALRWATLYNFAFDASTPPTPGNCTLGFFKTGGAMQFTGIGPAAPAVLGDLDGDGRVDGRDLGTLLSHWGQPGASDLNGDGTTDGSDLGTLLTHWG